MSSLRQFYVVVSCAFLLRFARDSAQCEDEREHPDDDSVVFHIDKDTSKKHYSVLILSTHKKIMHTHKVVVKHIYFRCIMQKNPA
jgi:hypothetical protein